MRRVRAQPTEVQLPPLSVRALLALTGCACEYVPEKWNRGARRKAYWRVWHPSNRFVLHVLRDHADFAKWHKTVLKCVQESANGDQADQVRS